MSFARASGILLHPTSLPSRGGIGDFGPAAYQFVDFLASARQGIWQVLPLGPLGFGNSPYSATSAFAGNPLLISLERLAEHGIRKGHAGNRPRDLAHGVGKNLAPRPASGAFPKDRPGCRARSIRTGCWWRNSSKARSRAYRGPSGRSGKRGDGAGGCWTCHAPPY